MNINLNDVEISILNMALKNIHGPDVDRLDVTCAPPKVKS